MMSQIGSITTKRKSESSRLNIIKAHEVTRSDPALLLKAYEAVKAGKMGVARAARTIAKCNYYRLKKFCEEYDIDVGL